jgi:hypothetical protein
VKDVPEVRWMGGRECVLGIVFRDVRGGEEEWEGCGSVYRDRVDSGEHASTHEEEGGTEKCDGMVRSAWGVGLEGEL